MRTYFIIPKESIVNGDNELRIEPASAIKDEILIGEIWLDQRPRDIVLNEAQLDIEIYDATLNQLIPSRITIIDNRGSLQTIGSETAEQLAVRPGMVYTGNGQANLKVPAGKYKIYAGRGFEYGIDSIEVSVSKGEKISRKLFIKKEVETDGWVSCDTHIHTLTHSGHGDASDRERAISIAGEGIELPIITEHNLISDLSSLAKTMNLDKFYTVVPGDEVTTSVGHFNYFPLNIKDPVPNYKVDNWDSLHRSFAGNKNKIIVLNHGRDIHNGFRPFDPTRHVSIAGKNIQGWILPANAMEVVNSGALLSDWMLLFKDWFGLLNHGFNITPVGGSDSHDVTRYLVGQGRTYIKAKDNDPANIPLGETIQSLKDGKVMVSFGLLAEIEVNDKYGPGELVSASNKNVAHITVSGPSWINADSVMIYQNGLEIYKEGIQNKKAAGLKWKGNLSIPKQKQDFFLVVIAKGYQKSLPYWPIVKPFQPTSTQWTPYVIGCSGAVWIDMDGDGKKTSAFDYAGRNC
jgi:hypothetical protein